MSLAPTGVHSADNCREWNDKVNLKIYVVAKSQLGKLHKIRMEAGGLKGLNFLSAAFWVRHQMTGAKKVFLGEIFIKVGH